MAKIRVWTPGVGNGCNRRKITGPSEHNKHYRKVANAPGLQLCIRQLLLCYKWPLKLVAEKDKYLLSHSFWGSTFREPCACGSGSLVSLQSSWHLGCSLIWSSARGEVHFQVHSCGCWLKAQPLTHGYLYRATPKIWLLPEQGGEGEREKEWETDRQRSCHLFHYLISEVAHHHVCCMSLVTQTNPGTMWEGTRDR